MSRYKLRLTALADQDLDDLYTEGFITWGEAQADHYFDGLLDRFDRICETPLMYRSVDGLGDGCRLSVYERHAIYFVIEDDFIEIRAVIKRQDISNRM